ncbi:MULTISPECIES: hypothetical protein [Flavobacterium]|uniref:Uncharacterized protein n=1 Tax=Flavobacterium jumunjinense TaxID=998845 RepID=A0ABV5GTQ9_9FLAO|nr:MULTISPECIES: hypothetical protein [Flavobacterium]
MRNIKFIAVFILILTTFRLSAQTVVANKMIRIEFQTLEKKSNDILIGSVIEVLSNGERIGIIHGDFNGLCVVNVCSKKIIDDKITINAYGMKCKSFTNEYTVNSDSKIDVYLEYGESKYQTLNDRRLILHELKVPICDIEIQSLNENENDTYYQHCDGRIKKKNEIPSNEIYEWEKLENHKSDKSFSK